MVRERELRREHTSACSALATPPGRMRANARKRLCPAEVDIRSKYRPAQWAIRIECLTAPSARPARRARAARRLRCLGVCAPTASRASRTRVRGRTVAALDFPGGLLVTSSDSMVVMGIPFSGPALLHAEKACKEYLPPGGPPPAVSESQKVAANRQRRVHARARRVELPRPDVLRRPAQCRAWRGQPTIAGVQAGRGSVRGVGGRGQRIIAGP
jgi:hypothetical protein